MNQVANNYLDPTTIRMLEFHALGREEPCYLFPSQLNMKIRLLWAISEDG